MIERMASLEEKRQVILAQEQQVAELLAAKVLDKPKPNIWMILIPILFVFYLNDYKKYKEGRMAFAGHFLVTAKKALEEAAAVVQSGKVADPQALARESGLSTAGQERLAELFALLIEHYGRLLRAGGDDFNSLVRSSYPSQPDYQFFLDRLNQAEKNLNLALKPQLDTTTAGVNDILSAIENQAAQIRRQKAQEIFGP